MFTKYQQCDRHTSALLKKVLVFPIRINFCFYNFKKLFPFGAHLSVAIQLFLTGASLHLSLKPPHSPTQNNFARVQSFFGLGFFFFFFFLSAVQSFLKVSLLKSTSTSKDGFKLIELQSVFCLLALCYQYITSIHLGY